MSKIIDYRNKPKCKPPPIRCWRDVERVAHRLGLTPGTVQMLIDRGFGSIKGMREITEDDLNVLPLYIGQQLAVSKLVKHLNTVLEGYDSDDTPTAKYDDGKETEKDSKEPDLTKQQMTYLERQAILARVLKRGGLIADEDEDGYDNELGLQRLPRPHQFILGKMTSKELTQEEFLYGNLLILEYFFEQKPAEVRASLKHIRFLILKLLHGYPLAMVIDYDNALRKKLERQQMHMPREADPDLIQKYLRMMVQKVEINRAKKKAKIKTKAKSNAKGKGKGKKSKSGPR